MYHCKWFKIEEDAIVFQKEHGGVLYKNVKHSRTREDHRIASYLFHFNAEEFPYSVNWNT